VNPEMDDEQTFETNSPIGEGKTLEQGQKETERKEKKEGWATSTTSAQHCLSDAHEGIKQPPCAVA